jgi:quercetin dioxygenase-like cupin family protein
MNRTLLALAAIGAIGIGGMALARHDERGGARVTQLARRDIIEKLDGKDAAVSAHEVVIEPGDRVAPHRHAGQVFGYVLEGEYEHALNDDPVKRYKAGDTFYEPSGYVHRVTRNPSAKQRTRLLAVIVHPRDAEKVTIPEGPRRSVDRSPLGVAWGAPAKTGASAVLSERDRSPAPGRPPAGSEGKGRCRRVGDQSRIGSLG